MSSLYQNSQVHSLIIKKKKNNGSGYFIYKKLPNIRYKVLIRINNLKIILKPVVTEIQQEMALTGKIRVDQ